MRAWKKLAMLALVVLVGTITQAQLKDMPSQAEFDPILENADDKLKGLVATLTEFRVEAAALDRQRLDNNLRESRRIQEAIQATKSGANGHNGISMSRLVGVLSSIDDFTVEAATWKSLAELRVCELVIAHQDASRYKQFTIRMAMSLQMLQDVGDQMFHPTLRMAVALDEVVLPHAQTGQDGNSLLRECQDALKIEAGGLAGARWEAGHCIGLVGGILDTHTMVGQLQEDMGGKFKPYFCLPDGKGIPVMEAIRIVVAYLKLHPAQRNQPETMLVLMALGNSFHCR